MKIILLSLIMLGMIGCAGKDGSNGNDGTNGNDGLDGLDGAPYSDVFDSIISTIKFESVLDITCTDGTNAWRGTGSKTINGILTAFHVVDGATSCTYWHDETHVGSGGIYTQNLNQDVASPIQRGLL